METKLDMTRPDASAAPASASGRSTLVVDIGGNNVKFMLSGDDDRDKVPSGPDLRPDDMVAALRHRLGERRYDRVAIGYPGAVKDNRPFLEPVNLGGGWTEFDFEAAFGAPVKLVNDAVMQALGSYDGGTMLYLGLGTGLGTALVVDGVPVALEVAHLRYKKGLSFEDWVGRHGLERLGRKRWRKAVFDITERLRLAMVADYVVIGGGNATELKKLSPNCRLGDNRNALIGGFRLWDEHQR